MMIPLLFFLVTPPPQQELEQQLRRQQQQLQQIQQELREQQGQLQRFMEVLERVPQRPVCSVDLRWVNGADAKSVPRAVTAVVQLNLFSTVSEPVNGCLPAEVRVTASFLDAADNLICGGTVEDIAIQNTLTQSVNLEVRPWDFSQFVRWRNEPPQVNSGFKRLICLNPEGVAEAASGEMDRIVSVRVRATVLPRGGGVSTAEIRLNRNAR